MAIPRGEAGVSENVYRPGLWPIPGEGVLARQGDLVLLASIADGEFTDSLLAVLEKAADTGGDGRQLVDAVEDALAGKITWPAGQDQPGLAVVAFGPAGPALALTIYGAAYAEITTAQGTQRLGPGQPGMQLRCVLSCPAAAVRSELSTGSGAGGSPDHFSHLDLGTIRAGGLVYIPETAAAPAAPAAARAAAPAATGSEPEPVHAQPQPVAVHAEPEPAPVHAEPEPAPAGASPAAQPFESVLLLGEALEEVDQRAALPTEQASQGTPAQAAVLASAVVGVFCKNGHFDDPEARFCAVCGISMNQQTLVPQPGTRPPLGVLVFDDGSIFQLDSDYVIGRDPVQSAAVVAGKARPLCVVDDAGIVSRAHAALQLDGWRVLLTDLGSANGTRIRHRDHDTGQQLPPHVSAELFPGSHVDLGGCGFQYESHRSR
jgi:hypothetical protein